MVAKTTISGLLGENDIRGERLIAVFQSFMALVILILHLVMASRSDWSTLNSMTLFVVAGILTASLTRIYATRENSLPSMFLHGLTVVDGALLFALIYSYNVAYELPFAASFKSPSIVLFIVFTCVRVVKFEPISILVASATVLTGWFVTHLFAIHEGSGFTTSYETYLTSYSILLGASFELAIGYLCAALALAYSMFLARGFIARTALVEDLEIANQIAEGHAAEFESIFASTVDGILIVDPDGNILRANSSLAQMFDYSPDELIGQSASVLMSETNAGLLKAAISSFMQGNGSPLVGKRFETRGIKKSGLEFPIDISINDFSVSGETRFVGFVQDITARKNSEISERQAKIQFESAVKAAMDAIIIIDEAGVIVGFNPAAEETFGFKQNEMLGRKLSETIIPARYREAHDKGMEHYLKTGEAPVLNSRIEIEALHASGEELLIELAIREVDAGQSKLFFGYARDIRDRKNAERDLIQAKEEAEVASLAKARFLAMMSHEIRTPLNGILGIVNLMDGTELAADQRRMLKTARQSGQSLLSVINDILDFSKIEAGKLKIEAVPFDCEELITSIANLFEPQINEKSIELVCQIDPKASGIFTGDPDRLRQVLVNLVGNAVKFTDSGRIEIHVEAIDDGVLRFDVIDTGMGIDEKKIRKLFKEFSTLDEHRTSRLSGTGLGLVICKSLVEAMGGEIRVRSIKDVGSQFWFELPFKRSAQQLIREETLTEGDDSFHELNETRILVAEDNITNQMIVRTYLERAGCLVDLADNGAEAVALFKKSNFDLVLMDISMPDVDGFQACKEIRESGSWGEMVPIIAFTAYSEAENLEEVKSSGMQDLIPKPFTERQLLGTLYKYLVGRKQVRAGNEEKVSVTNSGPTSIELDLDLFDGLEVSEVQTLLGQFSKDLRQFIEQIGSGMERENWGEIENASHRLKGSSGMFGARRLSMIAAEVNERCNDGSIAADPELAIGLLNETKQVLQQIEDQDFYSQSVAQKALESGSS